MPTYEYECLACKRRFERFQKFTEAPVSECPECGGGVRKVLFPAGVVFKGSGWYITDSRKGTGSDGSSEGGSGSSSKSDSKPETKTEIKAGAKSDSKSETSSSTTAKSESSSPAKA